MPLVSSDPDFNHGNPALNSAGSLTGTGSSGAGGTQHETGGVNTGGGAGVSGGGGISSSAGANRAEQQQEQQAVHEAANQQNYGGGTGDRGPVSGSLAHELGGIAASGAGLGAGMNAGFGEKDQSRLDTGRPDSGRAFGVDMVGTGSRGVVDPMGSMHPVSSLDTLGIRDVSFVDPRANAMKEFIGQGKTINQSAGLVGSMFGESAFNPMATDYATGTHKGIAQWGGERLSNLENFGQTPFGPSPGVGKPAVSGPTSKTQTDFVREEMMGNKYPDAGARQLQAAMEANPNMSIEEATNLTTKMFERPSKKEFSKSIEGRITAANEAAQGLGVAPGYTKSPTAAAFSNPMSSTGQPAPLDTPFEDYNSPLSNAQYMGQFPTHNMLSILGGNLTPEKFPNGFANPIGGGLTAATEAAQAAPPGGGQYKSAVGAPAPSPIAGKLMENALNDRGFKGEKAKPKKETTPPASTITAKPGPAAPTLEQNLQSVYGPTGSPVDWYEAQRAKLIQELSALGVKV